MTAYPTAPVDALGSPGTGSSSAVTFAAQAAEALSGHRAVTPAPDGTISYADPATIGNQPVWVTTQAGSPGDDVTVVAFGDVTENTWAWADGNVYLAATGFLTQTEPTSGALVVVGVATAPTRLFVDREQTIDL